MAKKKVAKKVTKKKVTKKTSTAPEPTPEPALINEPVMKVVESGQATYYTKTEYDKKYGK